MPAFDRIKFLLLTGSAVLILAGCAVSKPAKAVAVQPEASVFSSDDELQKKVAVLSQDSRLDPNGVFIARTVLENTSSSPVEMRVQTFFKNAAGTTADCSPSQEITLEPLERRAIVSKSLSGNVDKFIIRLASSERPAMNQRLADSSAR